MKRRSHRVIMRVLVFLLLGAIVNIAVAWGCAYDPLESSLTPLPLTPSDHVIWEARKRTGWPAIQSHAIIGEFGRTYDVWSGAEQFAHGGWSHCILKEYRSGWPLRSLSFEVWLAMAHRLPADRPIQLGTELTGSLPVSTGWLAVFPEHQVPIKPVFPGFLLGSAVYAGILWLLFAAPFNFRRWRRIKRGLCPKCGYPVGTSHTCTECGQPLLNRPIRAAV